MTSAQAVCPLCETSNYEVLYDLTAADSPEDVPGLVARCRSCPMWFKVLTGPDGIPEAYPGESGDDDLTRAYLLSDTARALFHDALTGVEVRSSGAPPRLLDIGAAQGALLAEAVRMGFDAEGIDHCASNVEAARAQGLKVTHMAAEDLDATATFDVVTMMDLIEHLPDPLRVLHAVHRALKPAGELVVYTPNHRGAVVALSRLLHAVGIHYPIREIFGRNHVCFFDDRSLPLALKKTGFAVRVLRQFPYDPSRPGQDISPLNLAAITAVEWLGKPFNRVFRMLVYARRVEAPS
jgi:2-polyprenyl-3-methyl-5-hydroxy-6-metoxy-1,4-benzoquinol methylase